MKALRCLFTSPNATTVVPEGYVVGPYSGQVYTREQYYERYSSLPARLEHERCVRFALHKKSSLLLNIMLNIVYEFVAFFNFE